MPDHPAWSCARVPRLSSISLRQHGALAQGVRQASARRVLQLLAEGLTNTAVVPPHETVVPHVASVFADLDLTPAPDGHRRVLAVLRWLRSTPQPG